jgi:transcriptional regulator with PAS, ATPase and Fis domain
LEEKAFERVGGNTTIHSDVRVIAATNRVLEQQIVDGKFREDLYYRINVLTVKLPPLRERTPCIEPLAYYLLEKVCRTLRKKITGFSHEVMDMFVSYTWPGNIRQLANTIERAAILTEDSTIQSENISLSEAKGPSREQEKITTTEPLQNHERALIMKALEDCHWVQKDAAKLLGISPRSLNYKIKKFGITHSNWKKNK